MAEDFGTDLCWNSSETTLGTVTGEDNLKQSIINRLNTRYEELNWVYANYGCNYRDYLGLKNNDTTLEFIKNSIKQSLEEETRIETYDLELSYIGDGVIKVILNIEGVNFDFNLGEEE
jgi:phage baseplate assembly protein W